MILICANFLQYFKIILKLFYHYILKSTTPGLSKSVAIDGVILNLRICNEMFNFYFAYL